MHGSTYIAATAAGLAGRDPFRLGDTLVSPASREVAGPGGKATIEPRVMQVLLALVDAAGGVVTRDDLIRICWHGQIVGEDAINRAVAGVRRVASGQAAGQFTVETITRVGYRLTGAAVTAFEAATKAPAAVPIAAPSDPSRRLMLSAGAIGVAAVAGVGAWSLRPTEAARGVADLAAQARLAMNQDSPEGYARAVGLLRQATAAQPDDAALWGKLALALRSASDFATAAQTPDALQACELAASRALALDARQPDARVALTMLRPAYGDWLDVESKLRAILKTAPQNLDALANLAPMLKSVGRDAEACAVQERVAAAEPLSPLFQYRLMYNLWTAGRVDEADRAIDRAIELWPFHPGVWSARLWLSAFTGRTQAALAQVNDAAVRPAAIAPQVDLLRVSVRALDSHRASDIESAVAANVAAAKAGPG
ncbi:MAG: winged helix-turn-helix domain-containing protein, partial [Phenylobacterium sp.]